MGDLLCRHAVNDKSSLGIVSAAAQRGEWRTRNYVNVNTAENIRRIVGRDVVLKSVCACVAAWPRHRFSVIYQFIIHLTLKFSSLEIGHVARYGSR